ncbi:hypothetical protein KEM56_003363 [Ascosphaera pollenicola]|nr:hypothetical protein KEM56_003363 [Ascosphaera pollenicola]
MTRPLVATAAVVVLAEFTRDLVVMNRKNRWLDSTLSNIPNVISILLTSWLLTSKNTHNDASKIRYGLQQISPPLWNNMRAWLTDYPGVPSWNDFIDEIESFLDIKFLKTDTRSQIDIMFQGPGKSVFDLFACMSVQWLLASFLVSEKLRAFRRALRPGIQSALLNVKDTDMRDERMFLEEARNAKHNLNLKQEANSFAGRLEGSSRWRGRGGFRSSQGNNGNSRGQNTGRADSCTFAANTAADPGNATAPAQQAPAANQDSGN